MATSLQVLRRAFDLLDEGYTTGSYAKDDEGNGTNCLAEDATSFCSIGAIYRASHEMGNNHILYPEALRLIEKRVLGTKASLTRNVIGSVAQWHDETPRMEVLRTWRDVISQLEEHAPIQIEAQA